MTDSARKRIAVLASGGGSNLQALLDYHAGLGAAAAGEVVLVASDRAAAGALERARSRGLSARTLNRDARTTGLLSLLLEHRIDLVALAGYLRLVPNDVTAAYRGHLVNVHPALLPEFGGPGMYGERVHAAVIDSGATRSGATVHFVDDAYDRGAIIAQWPVRVDADDSAADLARRVLAAEHALYPRVIQAVAAGRIALLPDGRVEGWSLAHGNRLAMSGDAEAMLAALDAVATPSL